jgi:hypothetical protein
VQTLAPGTELYQPGEQGLQNKEPFKENVPSGHDRQESRSAPRSFTTPLERYVPVGHATDFFTVLPFRTLKKEYRKHAKITGGHLNF